ncbi:glutamic-type intramembrane protease PrsW [Neobacillus cucumis]|uniref:glutamic-type intramembrane protease PrsW n=1 Tax=Neobacillus cucumis TaxID=1740721 RepID=UPI001965F462|nr:glutamic-type intramembrane protease PrsW [Neobacillus cucumis]MBM7655421.1 RsiW-degrading membrane proteinase PrsW (M82 family) [Neobacillus cucumis]MED4228413.1 glutamic-type intramembrane protease PrsW [Neobacillus cucumis]
MIAIILAGVAPGLALLSYFYLRDKYEPEPLSMVIRTFIFGALLIFPISFVEYIFETENLIRQEMVHFLFSSGILEEISKWLVLFFIAYRNAEFDEPFDGIVYGTSVALGFATAENVIYLITNGVEVAFNRALLPVSGHALFGVIMGYYMSRLKFTEGNKLVLLVASLAVPAILHGAFNYLMLKEESWIYTMIPFMIFLWLLGMEKVRRAASLSKNHFNA